MQTTPEITMEKLSRLAPRDVQGYVRSRGWKQFMRAGHLMVFNRPEENSLDQVLVPIDAARPDFAERMWDAVEKLSSFERVVSPRAKRGTLPLVQAIDLLTGAKQSLLAAAHSVLIRKKYHPKLSRRRHASCWTRAR